MELQKIFIPLLFCINCKTPIVHGQFSFSSFSGAEASGMAGSGAALTGEGALFSNPAGLIELHRPVVALSVENKFNLTNLNHWQIAAALPTSQMLVAAGWSRHGINQSPEQKMWVCFGKKISRTTSLGAKVSYLSQSAEGYQAWSSWTTELGVQRAINSVLRVGIYLFHPIGLIRPKQGMETRVKVGFQYLLSDKLSIYGDLDKPAWRSWAFRAGLSYSPATWLNLRAGVAPNVGMTSGSVSWLWKKNGTISLLVVVHQNLGMSSGVTFVQRLSSNKSNETKFENSLPDIPLPVSPRKR